MKLRYVVCLLIALVIAFLLLLPTKVEPVAWTPPPAPSLKEGIYADNQRLKAVVKVGPSDIEGPDGAAAGRRISHHRIA